MSLQRRYSSVLRSTITSTVLAALLSVSAERGVAQSQTEIQKSPQKSYTVKVLRQEPQCAALKQVLAGKRLREGSNVLVATKQGKVSAIIRDGQLVDIVLTNPNGQVFHRTFRIKSGGGGSYQSRDCAKAYDQCITECFKEDGFFSEAACNVGCGWDYIQCMKGVDGHPGYTTVAIQ